MAKSVNCDCGWSYTGEDDDLVTAVQQHGREVHDMNISAEQVMAMAKPA